MICAIYSQPTNSNYYSAEAWEELEDDIMRLTSLGKPFAIIGDILLFRQIFTFPSRVFYYFLRCQQALLVGGDVCAAVYPGGLRPAYLSKKCQGWGLACFTV